MSRFTSILVAISLCGSVTWLASQESIDCNIVRRLRGSAVTDASSPSNSTAKGDHSDVVTDDGLVLEGITRKDLKELGITESQVKEMMKGPLGVRGTIKLLHALLDLPSSAKHPHKHIQWSFYSQVIFGVIFYFLVASKFPDLREPNAEQKAAAAAIMKQPTPCRINFGAVCLQSLCFPAAMYAKVMKATNTANYWIALIAGAFFPCCTVFVSTQFCTMDQKLGLDAPKGCLYNAFESCCCSCCLIAQTTEALDAATGMESGCCSARSKVYQPVA